VLLKAEGASRLANVPALLLLKVPAD